MTTYFSKDIIVGQEIVIEKTKKIIKIEEIKNPNQSKTTRLFYFSDGTCEVFDDLERVLVREINATNKEITTVYDLIEGLRNIQVPNRYLYVEGGSKDNFSLTEAMIIETPIFVAVRGKFK